VSASGGGNHKRLSPFRLIGSQNAANPLLGSLLMPLGGKANEAVVGKRHVGDNIQAH
jgi:hypothetical protein